MQTKVSSKGQVVLPVSIRNKLRIKAGDPLEAMIQGDRIVLIPQKPRKFRTWIGKSSITGLPVLMSEAGAPKITNEQVAKLLEDFP
jgi:AbrB family looped-hinge helix DNA binding protein